MALTKAHNRMIADSVINVKDYGATGDGTTDDTAAIQAALNVGQGNVVYFPEGQYIVSSSLIMKSQTTVRGERRGQLQQTGTHQNYFGDYVNGVLIKYTGQWACFQMIGTSSDRITECKFESIGLWGAPATVTLTFADYKPLHLNSRAFTAHYGSGHVWRDVWFSGFGYAGIELGIEGTYNGTAYTANVSTQGQPNNCKIRDCYFSNVFGYALSAYTQQLDVIGMESDSFTINSSTYSGFLNPITSTYDCGGAFIANSVNVRFTSCHFEGHSERSAGVSVDRNFVSASSAYPEYVRFSNCNFFGHSRGLSIARTNDAFYTHVENCHFTAIDTPGAASTTLTSLYDAGLQSVIIGNSFSGSNDTNEALLVSGTSSVYGDNVFKGCNLPIKVSNNGNLVHHNTVTATAGSYSVEFSGSGFGDFQNNYTDEPYNVGASCFVNAGDKVEDTRLGISSTGTGILKLSHSKSVSATTSGTQVSTFFTSDIADRPFYIRVKFGLQNSSGAFGEALITGVSTTGTPSIKQTTLLNAFSYTATTDFLVVGTSSGTISLSIKSNTGSTAFGVYEVEAMGNAFTSYDADV